MLPYSYNHDHCTLLPITPKLVFAYWDYTAETWDKLEREQALITLELHREGKSWQSFDVMPSVKSFYFRDVSPNRRYRLILQAKYKDGPIVMISSDDIRTPADSASANQEVRFTRFVLDPPVAKLRKKKLDRIHIASASEQFRQGGSLTDANPANSPVARHSYLAGYKQASPPPLGYGSAIPWKQPADDKEGE